MKPAQRAARLRFTALACERAAIKAANGIEPWAIANSRAYLRLMSNAMRDRSAILTRYLASRKRRKASHDL